MTFVKKFPQWMVDQIKEDLEPHKKGISVDNLKNFCGRNDILHCSVLYEIRKGKVFVSENVNNGYWSRRDCVTKALNQLVELVHVPDVTILLYLWDCFDENTNIPLVVFSKNKITGKNNILMPDFEALCAWRCPLEQINFASKMYPWKNKREKAVWRGSTTGGRFSLNNYENFPRYKLVVLSKKRPDLIDARFTNVCQYDSEEVKRKLEEFSVNCLTVQDQIRYKYQILVDGNTAAWSRAIWQLFSNSVIFKQESTNIQWFYRNLEPNKNYIPVANDLSDLVEKINWAKKHDNEAKKIMLSANEFANNNLKQSDIFLYLYLLLIEISKLEKNIH